MITDWVRTTDEPKRLRLADEVQRIARALGRMDAADGLPQECAGRPQIWRTDFLECEDHMKPI
jgi:hypothetical protein